MPTESNVTIKVTTQEAFYLRQVLDRVTGLGPGRDATEKVIALLIEQDVPYDDTMNNIEGEISFI